MQYSNPRLRAQIENWPLGGTKRGPAIFQIERNARGERAVRITTGAPKKMTYAAKARIVDGDDGKTYIAELTAYGFITIMRSDMKLQQEVIHAGDPRHADLMVLFQ